MYSLRIIVPRTLNKCKGFFCEMSNTAAADVMARLQVFFGVGTDSALADAMNINRQTLGSWRARGRVPYEECVNLATEKGLSLDWLLIGEGQM